MKFRLLAAATAGMLTCGGAGTVHAQDSERCADQRKAAAERGVSDDFDLALCLLESPVEADGKEAAKMFKRLSDAGDPEATQAYAVAVSQGIGVPADPKKGQRLMEQAAAAGSGGALLTLSQHYWTDEGFYSKDEPKALAMKTKAAEIGGFKGESLGKIQWEIGMHHFYGEGTKVDKKTAFEWVAKGADNGSTDSMISRAVMLATADGVAEDDVAARGWYQKAIDQKNDSLGHALRGLGFMMYTGEGGPKDIKTACTYVGAALMLGDSNAQKLQEFIYQDMVSKDREACINRSIAYLQENVPNWFEQ